MAYESDAFFERMHEAHTALTFDDLTLQPRASEVDRSVVDTSGRFTEGITLALPFASAAMDTVTSSPMAIAMAQLGGIGIIHTAFDPERQGREVRKVKHALNGLIEQPITVHRNQTIGQVQEMIDRRAFDFTTFPVTTKKGKLVGMLTKADVDFELESKDVRVGDVMTPAAELVTGPPGFDINRAFTHMKVNGKRRTLPLVDDEGRLAGLYVLSDVLRLVKSNPDDFTLDDSGRLRVGAAVPTDPSALDRIDEMDGYLDVAVIDSSQGDSMFALQTIKAIRRKYPGLEIVGGNITDPESAVLLAKAGVNGIKIGQGPGSICSTRREIGTGIPQVTAVNRCAQALRKAGIKNVPICADGGIVHHGDPVKAIAAGAETVMMGGALAGTDESPGDVFVIGGKSYKINRGMGSATVMANSSAARARYDASAKNPLPQGVEGYVPYIGSLAGVLGDFEQGLQLGMAIQNAATIKKLHKRADFWFMPGAGVRESHPHDIITSGI